MYISGDMKTVDIFKGGGGGHKTGLFGDHFCKFNVFLLMFMCIMGICFCVAKISNTFLVCLIFLIFSWG